MTDHESKTHFRKAFDSPYLSSADIVEPTVLTIARVSLEADRTKKTKDHFNTAHFVERDLRPGEKLKPMILNASNSKTMRGLTGSSFIDDWCGVRVTIYVDQNVRFGKETVEGLRISPHRPEAPRSNPERDALVADLYETAKQGVEKLREKWTGLTSAQRKSVGTPEWEKIKAASERASAPTGAQS